MQKMVRFIYKKEKYGNDIHIFDAKIQLAFQIFGHNGGQIFDP